MSRKRHAARPAAKIDWLEHRTGYPSPEEREAIMRRRNQLRFEVAELIARDQPPDSPGGQRLIEKYGKDEVVVTLKQFEKNLQNKQIVTTESFGYRQYRQRYARFGGERPFFAVGEYKQLRNEHGDNFAALLKGQPINKERQKEISDLSRPDAHGPRPAPAGWLARRPGQLGTLVCPAPARRTGRGGKCLFPHRIGRFQKRLAFGPAA